MSITTPEDSSDPEEKQLCTSCTTPNDPSAHFCINCGAPLSSYATIAPFERLFAEGFIYRQATDHPRKLIVVLGVWLMFGTMALAGLMIIGISQGSGLETSIVGLLAGGIMFLFSLVMIWKSTRNYCSRKKLKKLNS